jgi:hypothetical protein
MRNSVWLILWALKLRVSCKRKILKDKKDSEIRKLAATIKFLMNINNDKCEWLFGKAFIGGNIAEFFISSGIKFFERLIKTIK